MFCFLMLDPTAWAVDRFAIRILWKQMIFV